MKNRDKTWYPYAVAACLAVLLFVFLNNFPSIWAAIRTFIKFFRPVTIGCVIAFIVNPLAKFNARTIFKKIKSDKSRNAVSCLVAFVLVIAFLTFALVILIPQLIDSVKTFFANLDGYIDAALDWLEKFGLSFGSFADAEAEEIIAKAESTTLTSFVGQYGDVILNTTMSVGGAIFQFIIAFMLSIYILLAKESLKKGGARLIKALFGEDRYPGVCVFLKKSNMVFNRYIVFNLIDSLIVGGLNAIFMAIVGMNYIGMISFIVALTNLIPTFGPLIGGGVGALILLLVNPMHALFFLIFTVAVQIGDCYFIKPKLFGDSLGVSGLWILIGVIVGGKMFGVIGILLSIPFVAILDFLYINYLLPWLEKRHNLLQAKEDDDED